MAPAMGSAAAAAKVPKPPTAGIPGIEGARATRGTNDVGIARILEHLHYKYTTPLRTAPPRAASQPGLSAPGRTVMDQSQWAHEMALHRQCGLADFATLG